MQKIILVLLLAALFSSCASVMDMPEALRPLSHRLISVDAGIRTAALAEYKALDDGAKKGVVLGITELFGKEDDPYRRVKMLSTLDGINAGAYALIPLIKAASNNRSIIDFKEINAYLSRHKPGKDEFPELVEMLKKGAWESRMLAMFTLSVLSKEAAGAVPEMMDMMEEFGRDPERYSKVFDSIAMINPEIAVAGLIDGIRSPDSEIRKNAMLKLMELNAYLNPKLPAIKDIVPALIRALYGADRIVSEMAEEGLKKIDDPDARELMGSYLKMGRHAINLLFKMAGTTPEEAFKKQEEDNRKKIDDYYRSIGREDAVGR